MSSRHLLIALVLLVPTAPSAATTLAVDSALDAGDAIPGDGTCLATSGGCTLRAAIDEANALAAPAGELVVSIPAGVYELTLAGSDDDSNATGDLDIRSHLILEGAGAGTTTIDAAGVDRVLDLPDCSPSWAVEIRGLTLTGGDLPTHSNGRRGAGGGIWNCAAGLTLRGVTVAGNQSGRGPDAVIDGDCVLIADSGVGGPGGGIYNAGDLTLVDSEVSGNSTGPGGDGIQACGPTGVPRGSGASGGSGGGIFCDIYATLHLVRSLVVGNHTGGGGTSYHYSVLAPPGDGGLGGGILANIGTIGTVDHSTIAGNWTGRGGDRFIDPQFNYCSDPDPPCPAGDGGSGGGIEVYQATLTVADSTIADNWTGRGGAYCSFCVAGAPGLGGGISSDAVVSVTRSTLSGNVSGKLTGGGYESNGEGGGLHQSGGDLDVSSSTFSGNQAYLGGGLYHHGSQDEIGRVSDTTLTLNEAYRGGGLYWVGQASWGERLELSNTILSDNIAADSGPDCRTGQPTNPGDDIQSSGFNLIGNLSDCGFALVWSDQPGGLALLGPLEYNGGPTLTHMPQAGSDAIEGGGNCLEPDQRGALRPWPAGGFCDVGAVEVGSYWDLIFADGFESGDLSAWSAAAP